MSSAHMNLTLVFYHQSIGFIVSTLSPFDVMTGPSKCKLLAVLLSKPANPGYSKLAQQKRHTGQAALETTNTSFYSRKESNYDIYHKVNQRVGAKQIRAERLMFILCVRACVCTVCTEVLSAFLGNRLANLVYNPLFIHL